MNEPPTRAMGARAAGEAAGDAPLRSSDAFLRAAQLSVYRGSSRVCTEVSLEVARGASLGIIGANGSGKTSLLLGLRGQLKTSGRLELGGFEIASLSRAKISRLAAAVPQRMEFSFPYTVEEMVLLGRSPHRHPWEAFRAADHACVARILDRLGLAALRFRRVDEISGGERRRVFLARALAQETPLLFLDEPTAGLDPSAQEELVRILREERDQGDRAIVVVLHDLRLVRELCDQVLALADGVPVLLGTHAEVLRPEILERVYRIPWEEYRGARGQPVLLPRRVVDSVVDRVVDSVVDKAVKE